MELEEFLIQTQMEVRGEMGNQLAAGGSRYPYPETVFTEVVMQHMAEVGMTYEPQSCHYVAKVGNANLKLSGYASSDEGDALDLFVSLYEGVDVLTPISDSDTKTAAEQCLRFLKSSAESKLARTMDESNDAYTLALLIQDLYETLEQIRVYVLTDRQAKSKYFQPREVMGKTIKLEVMDIERLHRHLSEGKPRDELVVNFQEVAGSPLPCVCVRGQASDYDYALTILPGETLRFLYEKYGPRLLEANVRAFLSATNRVNRGIRDTLRDDPEKFMAYNNGIVLIADEAGWGATADGGPGLLWLKGLQIVNGGQTTASLYFTKKKDPTISLASVKVPAKVIILRECLSPPDEEALISDISKFANSQSQVRLSDLSANKPFHVAVENLASTVYCPDGVGRWFYERAAGSYNVMLAREGTTPARLKKLRSDIPPSRRFSKTDLARFLYSWDQKPDIVSTGLQKNFERFMAEVNQEGYPLPDVADYKRMIGKVILYKKAQSLVRPSYKAFQGNVTTYLVSIMSLKLGERLDFERIWLQQDLSPQLQAQMRIWAAEVNTVLHQSSGGRMLSEWAKKPDCWRAVQAHQYSAVSADIPEVR